MSGKVEAFVRPYRPGDEVELIALIRESDVREIAAASMRTPGEAVPLAILHSERTWSGYLGGRLAFIGGVTAPVALSGFRKPWLLGTTAIDRHPAAFMRHCRRWMPYVRSEFPRLENHVDARAGKTVKWLRALGFVIHPAEPYGLCQRPFHRFTMDSRHVRANGPDRAPGGRDLGHGPDAAGPGAG